MTVPVLAKTRAVNHVEKTFYKSEKNFRKTLKNNPVKLDRKLKIVCENPGTLGENSNTCGLRLPPDSFVGIKIVKFR